MGREQKPVRVLSEYEPRRRRRPTLVIWRHIGKSRKRRRRKEEDLGTHQSDNNNNNNKTNSFSAKASTAAAGVTPEAEGEECRKNLIFAIHFWLSPFIISLSTFSALLSCYVITIYQSAIIHRVHSYPSSINCYSPKPPKYSDEPVLCTAIDIQGEVQSMEGHCTI